MRPGRLSVTIVVLAAAGALAASSRLDQPVQPPASEVTAALEALGRFHRGALIQYQAGYTWRTGDRGAPQAALWAMGELDQAAGARDEQWQEGGTVQVTVTAPDKSVIEAAPQALSLDARTFLVRLPAQGGVTPGVYTVQLTSRATSASVGLTETLHVVVPPLDAGAAIGQAMLFRHGPFSGADWAPVADLRLRHQERVKVEVAMLGPPASAGVRLLDRAGNPLKVPVATTRREENGVWIVAGEVTLAPLAPGDYVLEADVTAGTSTRTVLAPFRIVP